MTKEQFIGNYSYWDSYKPLLWEALENTSGTVIELGMGDGSTAILHEYCRVNQRELFSYESSLEYYKKFEHYNKSYLRDDQPLPHHITYVGNNWEILYENHRLPIGNRIDGRGEIGVLFSDEAPGEMRKYNISMFCNIAQVIVAHDTEANSDHGYKFSLIKPLFKYIKHFEYKGADATAFSNFIDVTKWSL